jgi:hypothetical protein
VNRQRSDPDPERIEFFESLDFGALVPEAYKRYRPAIVDGLVFFLRISPPTGRWTFWQTRR